jgi:hypothetical protein
LSSSQISPETAMSDPRDNEKPRKPETPPRDNIKGTESARGGTGAQPSGDTIKKHGDPLEENIRK